jgi:hypothetical protein
VQFQICDWSTVGGWAALRIELPCDNSRMGGKPYRIREGLPIMRDEQSLAMASYSLHVRDVGRLNSVTEAIGPEP